MTDSKSRRDQLSKRRLRSLLAAEEFCRAARKEYARHGIVGDEAFPWLLRWMQVSPKTKYQDPKPIRKRR